MFGLLGVVTSAILQSCNEVILKELKIAIWENKKNIL